MNKTFNINTDGFYGCLQTDNNKDFVIILYIDDDLDSLIGKGATKWFVSQRINVLAMSPKPKNKGLQLIEIGHIENAVNYLKNEGYLKIGIIGLSSTAMIALNAASRIPDITLTIVATPCDFVMEGTIEERLDGTNERPAGISSLMYLGKPLPYLPYAYRHPQYWQQVLSDGKARGDRLAAIELFEQSENQHPLTEDEFIKVENIKGHLLMVGAKDDVMWNTAKYINRMVSRLQNHEHSCTYETMIFEHGTHYVFPQGMVKKLLPFGFELLLPLVFSEAKGYRKECRDARIEIEKKVLQLCKNNEGQNN